MIECSGFCATPPPGEQRGPDGGARSRWCVGRPPGNMTDGRRGGARWAAGNSKHPPRVRDLYAVLARVDSSHLPPIQARQSTQDTGRSAPGEGRPQWSRYQGEVCEHDDAAESPPHLTAVDCTGRDWRLERLGRAERIAAHQSGCSSALRVDDRPGLQHYHRCSSVGYSARDQANGTHLVGGVGCRDSDGAPVNARTARDWKRWTEFVVSRPEVKAIAVELATGGRYAQRRVCMLERAKELGLVTGGRLRLLLRVGRTSIPLLEDAFASVHLLDINPFMKSAFWYRVVRGNDRLGSTRSFALIGPPVEDLWQADAHPTRSSAPDPPSLSEPGAAPGRRQPRTEARCRASGHTEARGCCVQVVRSPATLGASPAPRRRARTGSRVPGT